MSNMHYVLKGISIYPIMISDSAVMLWSKATCFMKVKSDHIKPTTLAAVVSVYLWQSLAEDTLQIWVCGVQVGFWKINVLEDCLKKCKTN